MDIEITKGWNPERSLSVARLYEEAFGAKFYRAIPDKQKRIDALSRSFVPEYSFVALSNQEIVGLAGFKEASGSLTGGLDAHSLTKELGIFRGLWACLVLSLFERTPAGNELVMDGIAVNSSCRGLGIGSRLLDALIEHASQKGFGSVRLDVIDTNPRARKLYESKGFKAIKTESFPWLRWLIGFSGATTMTLDLRGKD